MSKDEIYDVTFARGGLYVLNEIMKSVPLHDTSKYHALYETVEMLRKQLKLRAQLAQKENT